MKWIVRILAFVITLAVGCWISSWGILSIVPDEKCVWWQGIIHGALFPFNFIRSFFTDVLYKADYYTGAYNFFYWINAIATTWSVIKNLFLKVGNNSSTNNSEDNDY